MKRIALFLFLSCLSFFCLTVKATAQDTFIQVVSEPGVSVFLDGDFKGVTSSEFNGLIIEDVQPGQRTIRVVKEGFNPQEETISIQAGEVYSYRVSPFVTPIRITEQGSEGDQSIDLQIGALKIQSLPVEIGIEIERLGIDTRKTKDEWLAEDVPVGEYEAVFIRGSEAIRYTIEIKQDMQTHLFVNTISKEVELRSARRILNGQISETQGPQTASEYGGQDENEVFEDVEDMPEIEGGMAALYEILEYPWMAQRAGIEGRVIVQLVVDENGKVLSTQVVRSAGAGGLDSAAVKAIHEMNFSPGMHRGRPVKVRYTIPVLFRLSNDD